MDYRIPILALGLVPLALTVGCQKQQSKEDIIAEYEASKIEKELEQERVGKLEQELAELKEQQAKDASALAQKVSDDHRKALESQLAAAKKKAEEAEKTAKEAEAKQQASAAQQTRGADAATGETANSERRRPGPTVVNVPQGTKLMVSLPKDLTTDTHAAGDPWEGSLTQDVTVDGSVVWAVGARVSGLVSQSVPTGRLSTGQGALAIKLTEVGGASIDGGMYVVTVDSKGARNAKVIGGIAALGAIVGALSNKNNQTDHALGGAAIGAAVGTAVAAGTASTVVTIPSSSPITFEVPVAEKIVIRNRQAGASGADPK